MDQNNKVIISNQDNKIDDLDRKFTILAYNFALHKENYNLDLTQLETKIDRLYKVFAGFVLLTFVVSLILAF